jgi:hypothetical protein
MLVQSLPMVKCASHSFRFEAHCRSAKMPALPPLGPCPNAVEGAFLAFFPVGWGRFYQSNGPTVLLTWKKFSSCALLVALRAIAWLAISGWLSPMPAWVCDSTAAWPAS